MRQSLTSRSSTFSENRAQAVYAAPDVFNNNNNNNKTHIIILLLLLQSGDASYNKLLKLCQTLRGPRITRGRRGAAQCGLWRRTYERTSQAYTTPPTYLYGKYENIRGMGEGERHRDTVFI